MTSVVAARSRPPCLIPAARRLASGRGRRGPGDPADSPVGSLVCKQTGHLMCEESLATRRRVPVFRMDIVSHSLVCKYILSALILPISTTLACQRFGCACRARTALVPAPQAHAGATLETRGAAQRIHGIRPGRASPATRRARRSSTPAARATAWRKSRARRARQPRGTRSSAAQALDQG